MTTFWRVLGVLGVMLVALMLALALGTVGSAELAVWLAVTVLAVVLLVRGETD